MLRECRSGFVSALFNRRSAFVPCIHLSDKHSLKRLRQWFSGHIHQNDGNIWSRTADARLGLVPELPEAQSPDSPDSLDSPVSPAGGVAPPTPPRFAQVMQAFVFDALFG